MSIFSCVKYNKSNSNLFVSHQKIIMPSQPAHPRPVDDDDNNGTQGNGAPPPEKRQRRAGDMKKGEVPPVPDKDNQCHFFVSRKHRYCSLSARKGRRYCGEHSHLNVSSSSVGASESDAAVASASTTTTVSVRIPCPLDPNHTVEESKLTKHLLKCNARVIAHPYRVDNVNVARAPLPTVRRVQELTMTEIAALVASVDAAFTAMEDMEGGPIPTQILTHASLDERKSQKENVKHVVQQASLVGHVERIGGLAGEQHMYVEFGAGKGELGHYIHRALTWPPPPATTDANDDEPLSSRARFYSIDRSNFRQKFDRYMEVERLGLDIKDLQLARVPSLRRYLHLPALDAAPDTSAAPAAIKPVVAFSKHLCGGATDLTLLCLHNYEQDVASELANLFADSNAAAQAVHSAVIAMCCHHRCSSDTYLGLEWLARFGLREADVPILGQMSGWAICGERPKKQADNADNVGEEEEEPEHEVPEDDDQGVEGSNKGEHYSGMTHAQREAVGQRVKRVLDFGRVMWARGHGMRAHLVRFVERETSLENCALIVQAPLAQ